MSDSGTGGAPGISGEDLSKLGACSFEVGPIRPPSEGGSHSLLLRATRNCSWNRCRFCYGMVYGREKFELRPVDEIRADIDAVKTMADELKAISWKLGCGGAVTADVGTAVVRGDPSLNANQC
jgi:hypothetical protein